MTAKLAVAAKAMTEKTRQQSRVFRERDHAVADVARRQHLQLFAQTSGAAAVVGNSDDRGKSLDPHRVVGLSDEAFEPGEKCGKAGAAAHGYQLLTTCSCCLLQMNSSEGSESRTLLNDSLIWRIVSRKGAKSAKEDFVEIFLCVFAPLREMVSAVT